MRRAKVKSTGKIIEGFPDGKGHFDVPVDHCLFDRYDINDLEIEKIDITQELIHKDGIEEFIMKAVLLFRKESDKLFDKVLNCEIEEYSDDDVLKEVMKRLKETNR